MQRITVRRSTVKKLPAWMGGLPKLSFLELDEVQLQVWSLSKFTALQDAHFWDCNATKVQLHTVRGKATLVPRRLLTSRHVARSQILVF